MTKVVEKMDLYGNTIFRVAFTYMKNMQDAEDILQDVLIKYMTDSTDFVNVHDQ